MYDNKLLKNNEDHSTDIIIIDNKSEKNVDTNEFNSFKNDYNDNNYINN